MKPRYLAVLCSTVVFALGACVTGAYADGDHGDGGGGDHQSQSAGDHQSGDHQGGGDLHSQSGDNHQSGEEKQSGDVAAATHTETKKQFKQHREHAEVKAAEKTVVAQPVVAEQPKVPCPTAENG